MNSKVKATINLILETMFDFHLSHVSTVLVSSLVMLANSYCPGPGANPSFVKGPKVEQVSLTSVVLTWTGLVKQDDCADQFLVKWWNRNDPGSYELSDMLTTSTTSYQVNGLSPHRSYAFQAIAREDKGWLGADWNKSPTVYFTTTRLNPTVAPVTPKDVKHPRVDDREHNDELYDEYSGLREEEEKAGKHRPLTEEEDTVLSFDFLVIVGIILGALLAVLIAVGIVYNIAKKKAGDEEEEDYSSDSEQSSEDSLHLENYTPSTVRRENYTPRTVRRETVENYTPRGTARKEMRSYSSERSERKY